MTGSSSGGDGGYHSRLGTTDRCSNGDLSDLQAAVIDRLSLA